MEGSQRNILQDESGQEPTVLKILVGIILVSIGLGIGVTIYQQFGEEIQDFGFEIEIAEEEITMGTNDTRNLEIETKAEFGIGEGEENINLSIRSIEGDNLTAEFVSSPIPIGGSTNLTIETNNTPTGEYTIEIEGESKGNYGDDSISVNIT